ncbi:LysE family translocator [Jannaschia faecimaris]|uniref:LysE family translocator n=1 Tax=Jannaschia faecimaris TaxID=1244108 RepID=UPI001FCDC588|nr:LysE family transporter [Jannaschia faecimaris]
MGIYAAIVVSPGPSFALVSRLALQGERRRCSGAIVGLAIAATFYALLAMVGLAAILSQIGWLARTVQILGGLYLVYLGITAWKSSVKAGAGQAPHPGKDRSFYQGLRVGLLVNLSNPKAIAFFVSLYAVVVPIDAHWTTRACILAGGALMELAWYWLVGKTLTRRVFRAFYVAWARWIERVLGTVLIFFGGRLILSK